MDGARHELLPRAALAAQQHVALVVAQTVDGASQNPHPGRAADQLGQGPAFEQRLLELPVAAYESPAIEGLAHRVANAVYVVEGLGQVVERAAPDAADRALDAGVARDHDHLDLRAIALQAVEQIEPVLASEEQVEQHDVEVRVREPGLRLLRRGTQSRAVPLAAEDPLQRAQQQRLVVDQQDEAGGALESLAVAPGSDGCAVHVARIGGGVGRLEWLREAG